MKDVLTFWMDRGADGFRVDDINFLFEDPAMRNEPESGLIVDENDYSFLSHIYTVDSVN
jgi:alpha-glucosidase